MKKDGFIFIETITVLVVLALSLSMLLASYSIVVKRNDIKKYYNRPSEVYLLYSISQLGTTSSHNYLTENLPNGFYTDRNSCTTSPMNNFLSNCKGLFNDVGLVNFGIITNVDNEVKNNYSKYDAGMLKYLEQLKRKSDDNTKNLKYFIGRFNTNNEYYYASVEIGEN